MGEYGMRTVYDREGNYLHFITGDDGASGTTLLDDDNIVIDLETKYGHGVVGLTVMGPRAYLPLGKKGYDAETDTLTFGVPVDDPARVTENGDLVAYWQVDKDNPDSYMDAVGAAIKNVSKHLAPVLADLSE